MKSRVKKLWIKALKSGCYKQICGVMRDTKVVNVRNEDDGYTDAEEVPDMSLKNTNMCVMGVLADVALRESGLLYNERNWVKFAEDNETPTERLKEWAGLTSDEVSEMIDMNDGRSNGGDNRVLNPKFTFKEFANYIEGKF